METEFYICEFCQTQFKPKRRKAQKFCSATCRVKNHQHKNQTSPITPSFEAEIIKKKKKKKKKKISGVDITNAALGSIAADTTIAVAKHFLRSKENEPATKGDIDQLKSLIKDRYFPVRNLNPNVWGQKPLYDIETGDIIYL